MSLTGWPPGMLQDDSRELSRWFASRPDARRVVRQVAKEIEMTPMDNDKLAGHTLARYLNDVLAVGSASERAVAQTALRMLAAQPKPEVTADRAALAEEFDVRKILLDVVPGPDGMGHEVYAKSNDDVVRVLGEQLEEIERLEARLAAAPEAPGTQDGEASSIVGWMVHNGQIDDGASHAAMYNLSEKDKAFDAAKRWGRSITALQVHSDAPSVMVPNPLTDERIDFGLHGNLEDPSEDEVRGFYAGARFAEAVLREAPRLRPVAPEATAQPVGHVTVPLTRGGLEVGEAVAEWTREFAALIDGNPGQRFALYAAQPVQGEPVALKVTEEMHVAACKVLCRANGLDGTPQRMVDAMLAAAPAQKPAEPSQAERDALEHAAKWQNLGGQTERAPLPVEPGTSTFQENGLWCVTFRSKDKADAVRVKGFAENKGAAPSEALSRAMCMIESYADWHAVHASEFGYQGNEAYQKYNGTPEIATEREALRLFLSQHLRAPGEDTA